MFLTPDLARLHAGSCCCLISLCLWSETIVAIIFVEAITVHTNDKQETF